MGSVSSSSAVFRWVLVAAVIVGLGLLARGVSSAETVAGDDSGGGVDEETGFLRPDGTFEPGPEPHEVLEYTETSRRWRNDDGSMSVQGFTGPTFMQTEDGWRAIDTALVAEGGFLKGAQVPAGAARIFAGALGVGQAAVVVGDGERTVEVIYPAMVGRVATVDVDNARIARLLDGTGISGQQAEVSLTSTGGFKDTFTVASLGDAVVDVQVALPLGWSARQQGAHAVEFVDGAGEVAGVYAGQYASDAATPIPAETVVTVTLVGQVGPLATLEVSADQDWLASPGRVWPVRLDPEWYQTSYATGECGDPSSRGSVCDLYLNSDNKYSTAPLQGDSTPYYRQDHLRVGSPGGTEEGTCCTNNRTRTYVKWATDSYGTEEEVQYAVENAYVRFYEFWQVSSESRKYIAERITGRPPTKNSTWSTMPTTTSTYAASTTDTGGYHYFTITQIANLWWQGDATPWGVEIRAYNEYDTSYFRKFYSSNSSVATTSQKPYIYIKYWGKPPQPTNAVGTAGDGWVKATWDEGTLGSKQSPPTGYRVELYAAGTFIKSYNLGSSARSFTFDEADGVSNGIWHKVKIFATNQSGQSAAATTDDVVPNAAPSATLVSPADGKQCLPLPADLTAKYTDPDADQGFLRIQRQRLVDGVWKETASSTSNWISSGSTHSWTQSGLALGDYHWRAQAEDRWAKKSSWTAWRTFTVCGPAPAPTNVVATASDKKVSVTWKAGTVDPLVHTPPTKYRVQLRKSADGTVQASVDVPSSTFSYTFDATNAPIVNGTSYYVRVIARNLLGNGGAASSNHVIPNGPPPTATPTSPPSSTACALPPLQLRASYSDPDGHDGYVKFDRQMKQSDGSWGPTVSSGWMGPVASGATAAWGQGGTLTAGTYQWRVTAEDVYGATGSPSVWWTFRVCDPPAAPGNVRSTSHEIDKGSYATTLVMDWDAVSAEAAPVVYQYAFTTSQSYVLQPDDPATTDTGASQVMTPGVDWWFHVRAVDAIGQTSLQVTVGPYRTVPLPEGDLGWDGYAGWHSQINATLSNYVTSQTDVEVATVGPPLEHIRTYNSRSTFNPDATVAGWFGPGWSSTWQMHVEPAGTGTAIVGWPDGRSETHDLTKLPAKTAPDGYFSTLTQTTDGWELVQADHTVYRFATAGHLLEVVDRNGRAVTLTWDAGSPARLQAVADQASGRSLQFAWDATLNRVTAVSADDPDGGTGRLVWTYQYQITFEKYVLDRVCDPQPDVGGVGACWDFDYGAMVDGRPLLTQATTPRGTLDQRVSYTAEGAVEWTETPDADDVGTAGERTVYQPDPDNKTVTVIDPRGVDDTGAPTGDAHLYTTVFTYDTNLRLVSRQDPPDHPDDPDPGAPNTITYGYDIHGNRDRIADATGVQTLMEFTAAHDTHADPSTVDAITVTDPLTDPDGTGPATATTTVTYHHYNAASDRTATRDGRSTGPTDDTFKTAYTYDTAGNRLTETTPTTAQHPSGTTTRWLYTDGTQAAVDGGTIPAGLKLAEVAPNQTVTGEVITPVQIDCAATDPTAIVAGDAPAAAVFCYDAQGDLRISRDRAGLVTVNAHDQLGRVTTTTAFPDAAPAGVTTSYEYDETGNVTVETAPPATNPVSGVTHQARVTRTFDANGNLTDQTVTDLSGVDAARTTTYGYDAGDRQNSMTDPAGGTTVREHDGAGNVTAVTDPEGRRYETVHDGRNLPVTVTLANFKTTPTATSSRPVVVETNRYDDAGRLGETVDAEGRTTRYVNDGHDRKRQVWAVGFDDPTDPNDAARDVLRLQHDYDLAGHLTAEIRGDGTANRQHIAHDVDPAGRTTASVLDESGINRTTTRTFDANGNLTREEVGEAGRSETTEHRYDPAGRVTRQIVHNDAGQLLTTAHVYDNRDRTATVDPRGVDGPDDTTLDAAYRTDFGYDELGRQTTVASPPVTYHDPTTSPTTSPTTGTARPTVTTGYDIHGNTTHRRDERGHVTTTGYDRLDRKTTVTHPAYTPLGGSSITPTETFAYDQVGNLTAETSRRGHTTSYVFDSLNRVRQRHDPPVGTQPAGVTTYEYDDVGNRTRTVDPTGAATSATYDRLDRTATETVHVRRVTNSAGQVFQPAETNRWTYRYDDLDNRTFEGTPTGATTTWQHNAASEPTIRIDPAGKTWTTGWQLTRQTSTTDPLGRTERFDYDLAGRLAAHTRAAGTPAAATWRYGYDQAGNRTSETSPRGDTDGYATTVGFDAVNRPTTVTLPAEAGKTITTSYGYDLAGNHTRLTDGRDNTTTYAYQSWNLQQTTVEPAVIAAQPGTWTTVYDRGGLPVEDRQPGGVTVTRTYDELGRLTREHATSTDPAEPSATRTHGYDLAGRSTSISHPDGTITLTRDDRGLLLAADAPGTTSDSTHRYDRGARPTAAVDPAGTTTYSWTDRNQLATATDPLTATTRTYSYDDAGQPDTVTHAPGNAVRDYDFDPLGRLDLDRLLDGAGTVQAASDYGYDPDGNLTSLDIQLPGASAANAVDPRTDLDPTDPLGVVYDIGDTLAGSLGNPAAGTHLYTYDRANRIRTWTHPILGTTTYGWDDAHNRTTAGTTAYTYDTRNRLTAAGTATRTYTPRGTLTSDGTNLYAFDALSRTRQITLADTTTITYRHDGLDRTVDRTTASATATLQTDRFAYHGEALDPVDDGTARYARTPAGRLLAADPHPLATGTIIDGTPLTEPLDPPARLAGLNHHGDLALIHDNDGTLAGTRVYDPFGQTAGQTGLPLATWPAAGFQADYTDPLTGDVNQHARWYQPGTATFTSRDTHAGELATPISLNRYTYAHANPLRYFDPDGRRPIESADQPYEPSTGRTRWTPPSKPTDRSGGRDIKGGSSTAMEATGEANATRSGRQHGAFHTPDDLARRTYMFRGSNCNGAYSRTVCLAASTHAAAFIRSLPGICEGQGLACHLRSIAKGVANLGAATVNTGVDVLNMFTNNLITIAAAAINPALISDPVVQELNDLAGGHTPDIPNAPSFDDPEVLIDEDIAEILVTGIGLAAGAAELATATVVGELLTLTDDAAKLAPRATDEFVDLTSATRRSHILYGDETGGGHLWPGLAGKSPFPQSWSAERILHEISDIATDPAAWRSAIPEGKYTVLNGTRGGVDIRVVVDSWTGEIITGTPTSILRNPG